MSPGAEEVVLGAVAVVITGGAAWWGRFVTTGAQKAHRIAEQMTQITDSLRVHEEREEAEFTRLRADVTKVSQSVAEVHGNVVTLVKVLVNGGKE